MGFPLTEEQKKIVDDRGGELLVSAAAGSGKTRVLVERLLDRVTREGLDIDQFLVITYTKAAAAELRSRIALELSSRLAQDPGDRHLRRQATLVYRAQISTIHSFCAALLRESGHLLDLDPDFRLCDEGEANILMVQVLDDLLEGRYENIDPQGDFAILVDTLAAGRDDSRLVQIVLDVFSRVQSHPDPLGWLAEQKWAWALEGVTDAGQTPWGALLLEDGARQAQEAARRLEEALALCGEDELLEQNYAPSLEASLAGVQDFLRGAQAGHWDQAAACLPVAFPPAGRKRKRSIELSPMEEERAARAGRQLVRAIRAQNFEQAAMLRDAEGDFRRELELGKRRWREDKGPKAVEERHIRAVLSRWTGVPVGDLEDGDRKALAGLEDTLRTTILGQDQAVEAVARAIRRGRLGLKDPNRPVGSFLLLGPSGVGKTQLCRSLSQTLFGSREALNRFDMSEYMEAHSVSRLIGSPPGYVGHEEGGQLTERVRRNPWSVVLLDELEKAHRDVWSVLLQVMEEGVLTDAQGRKTDFRNVVLVMTSNLGARHFRAGKRLGFGAGETQDRKAVEAAVLAEARATFAPEFLNRLDGVQVFHPLERDTLRAITRQLLEESGKRLSALGVTLEVEEDAVDCLAQGGGEKEYGARPLRRAIAAQVEDPAADLLLAGGVQAGDRLLVRAGEGKVCVAPVRREGNSVTKP